MARLAVVGVGRIGGEVAYLAASMGIIDELILYDVANDLLRAQVLDLEHTGLPIPISTDKTAIRDADICIFSAGMPRNPTIKTRADLLEANLSATRDGIALLKGFSGILITVTNPMDANNFMLCKKMGFERDRCIGFGGQTGQRPVRARAQEPGDLWISVCFRRTWRAPGTAIFHSFLASGKWFTGRNSCRVAGFEHGSDQG